MNMCSNLCIKLAAGVGKSASGARVYSLAPPGIIAASPCACHEPQATTALAHPRARLAARQAQQRVGQSVFCCKPRSMPTEELRRPESIERPALMKTAHSRRVSLSMPPLDPPETFLVGARRRHAPKCLCRKKNPSSVRVTEVGHAVDQVMYLDARSNVRCNARWNVRCNARCSGL